MENKKELTKTEKDILILVSKGYSNKRIGNELYISYHTVKTHIQKIIYKLNATDRTNAVFFAVKNGII